MSPEVRALLLATLAGMSTMLGALVIFFTKGKSERVLAVSLGLAAGVMISVSLVDLYQEASASLIAASGSKPLGVLFSVLSLAGGMCAAAALDRFVPHEAFDKETGETPHKNLLRVGMVSTLAIGLHNLPEGVATFMAGYENASLGITVAVAIAMHNIPEGVTVALPLYFATGKRGKAVLYTFLSGIAEPIGALLAFLLLKNFINDAVLGVVFGLIAGIMLYIAVEELIPSSRQYGYDRAALVATLSGLCVMPLSAMLG